MDKKTAVLTLVERLNFVFGKKSFNVVSNTHYQKKLMEESIACYQIGISTEISHDYLNYYKDNICQKAENGSNYMFIDFSIGATDKIGISSFAIIGQEEVSLLRGMLYKDVPRGMVLAMDSLGIKNYLQLYRNYSNGSIEKLLMEYALYSKLKNSLAEFFNASSFRKHKEFEEYFGEKTEKVAKMLKDMSLNNIFNEDYVSKTDVNNAVVGIENSPVFKDTVLLVPEFVDFVFKLPQKDLNLGMNKKILALFQDRIDYPSILAEEYTSGNNFKEYWSCLSEDSKSETVRHLSNVVKQRNLVLDSFLWHEGFKDIKLDHMSFYREDAEDFISYFRSRGLEERKTIIKDLLGSDFVNEEVIRWLNENEPGLIREVGLNG